MRKIIDTNHAIDRYLQRYKGEFSREEVNDVIYRAMDKIINDYSDISVVYVVWSRSTNITLVLDWREDYNDKDGVNHAIIITLPPLKKEFADLKTTNRDDVKLMVERHISARVSDHTLKESHSYIQKDNIEGVTMFVEDGKVFDYGIDFFLEID
jgi:hypothetical protein